VKGSRHDHHIEIVADPAELAARGAEEFARAAAAAVAARGRFRVALSGGSTPRALYSQLASADLSASPWDRVEFFFGDERHVPSDHPDSNYRMALETLLSKAPIPPANVHRIRGEDPDAAAAALAYEQELRLVFQPSAGELPRFDLILLGMGPDGHTASLFPGSSALHERQRWVAANWVEKFSAHRITLTIPVLNAARAVLFLVAGADKAATLKQVLEGPVDPARLPVQSIQPTGGTVRWLVDRAAGSEIMISRVISSALRTYRDRD
jgi:6-phosphogluconolactonase